ncbi:MAG: CYTH domain-containing protein [Candidatus Kaiserbacteria bacterium]|nr:CYTH domain-containing protein [Candidatus Kaiserbacteria bacterium]
MQTYEVEIKALLGSSEKADEIRAALKEVDPECEITSRNSQLNHYFEGGQLHALFDNVGHYLNDDTRNKFRDLISKATEYSVRTRDKDNIVLLVVKASTGADSSENGVSRIEIEAQVPLTLIELDELVLQSGFHYQAKWSREREEYACGDINVCLDKNAGYGYLAEFERIVDDPAQLPKAQEELREFMAKIGAEELPQDRLERMFAFYNAHWPEYYGTDRIFIVE